MAGRALDHHHDLVRRPRLLLFILALVLPATLAEGLPSTVEAAPVAWGTVLVSGSSWAGQYASLGDLNVYSNGNGAQDQQGPYGLMYECVELAVRWAELAFGDNHNSWNVTYATQMWQAGPRLRVPFLQHPNGGSDRPQFGDLLVFDSTSSNPSGHVAVVSAVGPDYVDVVEQNYANYAPTGTARLPINGTRMPDRWGLPILGWLRAATAPSGWQVSGTSPGGYVSDRSGAVHPFGSAPDPVEQPVWPTAASAAGVGRIASTASGYVLDSWGALHSFGGAPRIKTAGAYWPGQDLARALALEPSGKGGYMLDAHGGLHAFGDAPQLTASATWPGWDIARGLVVQPSGGGGWVLDAWGGLHPFGTAPTLRAVTGYSAGQDVARGICLRSDALSGWWVDRTNVLHSFGGAPAVSSTAQFPGEDVARGIVCSGDAGGYTLTAWGNLRPFGDAPPLPLVTTFSNPVAAGLAQ